MVKRILRYMLLEISRNRPGQKVLERIAIAAQSIQGIGSGGDVASSGESAVLKKFRNCKKPTSGSFCIFDVGANVGKFTSLAVALMDGMPFEIHAFEPSLRTYEQLQRNCGELRNVKLNRCGLGREPGVRVLYSNAECSGLASLTKRRLTHFGGEMNLSEMVEIDTVDVYCANNKIERIDLLKMDVEGHELDVLYGCKEMFDRSAIGLVTFEFGGCNIDTRTFVQDFFYFFANLKMRMARITPSGYWHELTSYKEIHEQFRTTNFVCYHSPSK